MPGKSAFPYTMMYSTVTKLGHALYLYITLVGTSEFNVGQTDTLQ